MVISSPSESGEVKGGLRSTLVVCRLTSHRVALATTKDARTTGTQEQRLVGDQRPLDCAPGTVKRRFLLNNV
jgi:hypothetical protein